MDSCFRRNDNAEKQWIPAFAGMTALKMTALGMTGMTALGMAGMTALGMTALTCARNKENGFMKYPYTGVILAGGLSTRFEGTNKAFIRVRGQCILDRIYKIFKALFEEIILVTNEPIAYLDRDMMITADLFPIRSSLTGIHAGLFFAARPYAFFTACDAPFLQKELVELILNEIGPGTDVVIPRTSAGFEPLCAVYSKECVKLVENRLIQQKLRIRDFFKSLRVKKIPENILREKDPGLLSFFNINTPDDLKKAEAIAARGSKP